MKIVHFAISPLAGAPVRLVRAQRACGLDARLVDLKRWGLFDHDLVADEHGEQAAALAREADILHLHNTVALDERGFAGVDFAALAAQGKAVVRQFHSPRSLVARHLKCDPQALAAGRYDRAASLVVAQYHERQYPAARVVPNIIDVPADATVAIETDVLFGYAAGYADIGAWDRRWATKGAPETLRMLRRLASRRGASATIRTLCDVPHAAMLAARRASRIVLDELVTGSYHLSALESLAAGRATLGYLDQRCRSVLAWLTGSAECPLINVPLEHAESVLEALLDDPAAADEIGAASRRWFQAHYDPRTLVDHYRRAYELLLESPGDFGRQGELAVDSPGRRFVASSLGEAVHRSRAARGRGLLNRLLGGRAAL